MRQRRRRDSEGVALLVETVSDNANRTVSSVRSTLSKRGGKMGEPGSVAWMFERKASFPVDETAGLSEDRLMEIALEAGAEDLVVEGGRFEIRSDPSDFVEVRAALEAAELPLTGAEVSYLPKTMAVVDDVDEARKVVRLLDALEDHDDVQNVFANFEFSDRVLESLAGA